MSKIGNIAKSALNVGGGVTRGLEKIKLADVIKQYPDGVTINGMDRIPYEGSYFYVFTFAEDAGSCFSGGMALTQMADSIFEGYDGDMEAINADLQVDPLHVKMEKVKTKNRRDFTRVTFVEPKVDAATGEITAPF